MTRHDPGPAFRALHQPGNPFILANAWDAGSARILAALGAQAIGTTSGGMAFTMGKPDMGHVSRDDALAHAQLLVEATDLPVSGDFENGYADDPDGVAETVRLACEVGLAGCSIEDTALPATTPYDFDLAVERVKAAVAAARALPRDFVLVARADGILTGAYDIEEAMRRLAAFDAAGADCLYAPLPKSFEDYRRICSAFDKPVNVLAAGPYAKVDRAEFADAGAARISFGTSLARVTHAALIEAAGKILGDGDFTPLLNGAKGGEVDRLLAEGAGSKD